jgi:hypothetical protein
LLVGTVTIDERFCGPPRSANGGYACGSIAAFVDGSVEVTLLTPPPLNKAMQIVDTDTGVALYDDETLIGTARPSPVLVHEVQAPEFELATQAASRTFPPETHTLPTCFVCGPQRNHGDGLRIHPGPVDENDLQWNGLLAAPWEPDKSLTDHNGIVRPQFVWAALDCPTAYASSSPAGMETILLGRQTVRIDRRPVAGERCVVAAWETAVEGRKHFADATLFGEDGCAIAFCNALWIKVSPEVQRGDSTR